MKLYIRPIAPNAVKVMIFMAERGVTIETIDVETLSPEEYRRVSPLLTVPALDIGTGLTITESLTICQYLDEVSEGPSLFGEGLEGRTLVSLWERRAELMLMNPAIEYGHHTAPFLADTLRQFPDYARDHVVQCGKMVAAMEERLGESRFLAGDDFTMARHHRLSRLFRPARLAGDRTVERASAAALARGSGIAPEHGAALDARRPVRSRHALTVRPAGRSAPARSCNSAGPSAAARRRRHGRDARRSGGRGPRFARFPACGRCG